jgi:hypothetical protein
MAADPNDPDIIPAAEIYKGCRVHNEQPVERIERVVKPEIDKVLASDDLQALYALCQDVGWCPEARLLARSKLLAAMEASATDRMPRPPGISVEMIRAHTAGLDVCSWRDHEFYCSSLECWRWNMPTQHRPANFKFPVRREVPLVDD